MIAPPVKPDVPLQTDPSLKLSPVPVSPRPWIPILALIGIAALQSQPGLQAIGRSQSFLSLSLSVLLWIVASTFLAAAAFRLAGIAILALRWRRLSVAGAFASLPLISAAGLRENLWLAIADAILIGITFNVPDGSVASRSPSRFGRGAAYCLLVYAALIPPFYAWSQHWGATSKEVARVFGAERTHPDRRYLVDHVVSVAAPADLVWPWLVQMGQDRAGFYSYDGLERLVGLRIQNATTIHPEWQNLYKGDFVRACPKVWLGGRRTDLTGWKVAEIDPNRLLVLENWGAFWLEPTNGGGCRLGIRSEITDVPAWYAPIHAYIFTPIHFLMEQRMLRTLRDHAERRQREVNRILSGLFSTSFGAAATDPPKRKKK